MVSACYFISAQTEVVSIMIDLAHGSQTASNNHKWYLSSDIFPQCGGSSSVNHLPYCLAIPRSEENLPLITCSFWFLTGCRRMVAVHIKCWNDHHGKLPFGKWLCVFTLYFLEPVITLSTCKAIWYKHGSNSKPVMFFSWTDTWRSLKIAWGNLSSR